MPAASSRGQWWPSHGSAALSASSCQPASCCLLTPAQTQIVVQLSEVPFALRGVCLHVLYRVEMLGLILSSVCCGCDRWLTNCSGHTRVTEMQFAFQRTLSGVRCFPGIPINSGLGRSAVRLGAPIAGACTRGDCGCVGSRLTRHALMYRADSVCDWPVV